MSNTIPLILDRVKDYLHEGQGTGIFDPERMTAMRMSNCFGRQAIIGSAILEELPNADVFLLVARNHGMPFVSISGRNIQHLAHTESVVIDGSDTYFIDTPPPYTLDANPTIRDISETTWVTEARTGVIHHQNRNIELLHKRFEEPELHRLYGPATIRALRHIFDVYPFEEGLDIYQRTLGKNHDQLFRREDYTDFYYSTIMPTISDSSELATSA